MAGSSRGDGAQFGYAMCWVMLFDTRLDEMAHVFSFSPLKRLTHVVAPQLWRLPSWWMYPGSLFCTAPSCRVSRCRRTTSSPWSQCWGRPSRPIVSRGTHVEWIDVAASHLALEAIDVRGNFRPRALVPLDAFAPQPPIATASGTRPCSD